MYKKNFLLFVITVLLLTGCTRVTNNLDEVISAVMTDDNRMLVNTVSTGYELYVPTGVGQVTDSEYNQKFKVRDRYMYLYVDTISYYYKNMLNYKTDEDYSYYYKKIDLNGKTGYIGINKVEEDLYYTQIVYNYSKIEFYSDLNDLSVLVADALIIQKSIKYNDNLIGLELESITNDSRDLKYELDRPKDAQSTFSDYLQEYVPEEDDEVALPDDN